MIRLPRLFALSRRRRARPQPTDIDALLLAQDAALHRRRMGREARQASAAHREAARHHEQFTRDPIIRALRPDLISHGDQ